MNLRVLKLFCWINWPINSFCTMSFCPIFRLPSQILAFIRGLPDFFVFCFNRLPSVSINFYLSFCEKNLVLPCPSLVIFLWSLLYQVSWFQSAPVDTFSRNGASPQSFNHGDQFLFRFTFSKNTKQFSFIVRMMV